MPDAVLHPTPQELTAFGLGKLPEHAAAIVAAHLEQCSACRQVVAGVSSDTFLDKVRAAGPAGSSFPPSLAQPAIPTVPTPDIPPELARHPKYLILRELNRGGMGVVYQARHKEMGRQIVIKVIKRSLLDQPGALDRFRREIQAAAQLSHPNIVTAYDAEQVGDTHLLVMEFVPGHSLAEVLDKKGPLAVDKACHYLSQAAAGLQHAYNRNMVHRDIKPSNLMLTPQGRVKILDFGLAKIVSESGTRSGITASDTYMGTPEYSAPEQATNARTADIRADIYSLGCTLYCLLAGRPPFREESAMQTVLAHMQKQPQPLTELRPDVPERLWRVIARLLAKEPRQRYQKPNEVVLALAPFVKPSAKGGSAPAPDVGSPVKGTVIETGSEIEKIERVEPRPARRKEAPAKIEASPFAGLTDQTVPPGEAERLDDEAMPPRLAWWKRPGVLAGAFAVSLALIVITVIIIVALKQNSVPIPSTKRSSNTNAAAPAQPKPQEKDDDNKAPPPEPKPERPKQEQEEELPNNRPDPEPPKVAAKPEEKPVAPQPAAPQPPAPRPPVAAPGDENKQPPANPAPPEPNKPTPVDVAIDKGVRALRKMQNADGTWQRKDNQTIGATALAGLTLLECGAATDDDAVVRAADVVRKEVADGLTHTYSISLSILFLDRLGDPDDVPLIESLMVRLLAGQDAITGGWTYDCPHISDAEMRRLDAIVKGRKKTAGRREANKPGAKRKAEDLAPEIHDQLRRLARGQKIAEEQKPKPGARPLITNIPGDNSNTQFAALAIWVGRRYGLPIETALKPLDHRFRSTQMGDGGWQYVNNVPPPGKPALGSTASMTCAGVLSLAISDGATLEKLRENKPNAKATLINQDENLNLGLKALGAVIGNPKGLKRAPRDNRVGGRTYYFLWSLERVAVALGLNTIGKKDWYGWGSEILLDNQLGDGSWSGEYAGGGVDTCFALLFLKRSNLTRDMTAHLKGQPIKTKRMRSGIPR